MTNKNLKRTQIPALIASAFLACLSVAFSQTAASATPARIRATIENVTGDNIEVTDGQKKMKLTLAHDAAILGVSPAAITDIKSDRFIGAAAVPQPDGTLKALEITIFPSGMKAGEGHYPWDMGSKSTMTNGTVSNVVGTSGRTITVKYPNGEKKIVVPNDAPIVRLEQGGRDLLIPGAHAVFFMSRAPYKPPTAIRVAIGKNGVVPPM